MKLTKKTILAVAVGLCVANGNGLMAMDWPQWRGPDRDDTTIQPNVMTDWPDGGPRKLWVYSESGNGYSGPAIVDGRLFVLGTRDRQDVLIALDAQEGKELWATPVGRLLEDSRGDGPRATPTVDGDHIYALGGRGDLICAKANNGTILWRVSMVEDLGGRVPGWGYSESVLVDGNRVVCTPGGEEGAIAALDKSNGRVIWRSEGFTDGAQYASPIKATIHGIPQYIQLTMDHVAGIAVEDGRVLWTSDWPGRTAVIPTPIVHENYVYMTSSYGAGCKLVRIKPDRSTETVYENKVMKNHHGGVVLLDGHVYGYSDGAGWVCQKFMSGEMVWNERSFGKGSLTCVNKQLYCLEEGSGILKLVDASTEGWKPVDEFNLEPKSQIQRSPGRIWTHPVVANGRLYLRDQEHIIAYDVSK